MSNYNSLKSTIDANIKQNGNQEITGQILNSVLNAMVTTLGTGYQFAGVATIATNPGTPDAKVFYIANGKGTYEKFGGLEVTEDDVVVFYWDSSWHKVSTGIASNEKLSELGVYVENPDFIYVKTDSENRILWAIKADGSIYYGKGVPRQVIDYIQKKIEDFRLDKCPDILTFIDDFLEGDKTLRQLLDEKIDKEKGKSLIDEDYAEASSAVEDFEYIKVDIDSNSKIIEGTKTNGRKVINKGLDISGTVKVDEIEVSTAESDDYIEVKTDVFGKVIEATTPDNTKILNGDVKVRGHLIAGATIGNEDDVDERIEVKTDSEGKVISYRDGNGRLVEPIGIESERGYFKHLDMPDSGYSEFIQTMKEHGLGLNDKGDWSNYISNDGDNPLHLPIPRCAIVNITNDAGDAVWPASKTVDYEYYIEYFDMEGNYFRKPIIFNAQGNSSLGMPKKNGAVDFFDSEHNGNAFSIKFGNWVPQDSFHLKAYYADYFVGVCPIGYKLFDQITGTRDVFANRDWKKALLPDKATIGIDCNALSDMDDKYSLDNDARCYPDGFPCICFLNGNFYGVYSWQLKKHRDNYMMSKKNPLHIHLDGSISDNAIFMTNGDINWDIVSGVIKSNGNTGNTDGVEIRNPKPKKKNDGWGLTCINGTKYDGDTNMKELMGADAVVAKSIVIRSIPDSFTDCIIVITIGTTDFTISVSNNPTLTSIAEQIAALDFSSVGYSCSLIYTSRLKFIDTQNRGAGAPDISVKVTGTTPITYSVDNNYSIAYDSNDISHVKSNQTKQALITLSTYVSELAQMESNSATTSTEIRARIAEMFDVESFIDYLVFGDVVSNYDGFVKNWQWITWDGLKWFIEPYDLDGIFGWSSWDPVPPTTGRYGNNKNYPTGWIIQYYQAELEQRYALLRKNGIISTNNILNIFKEWIAAIGTDNMQRNHNMWPNDREHYYAAPVETHHDSIYRVSNWLDIRIAKCDEIYNYNV